jgi:hypothetical protein
VDDADAQTEALEINDQPWQYKEPKRQPLYYYVPTDSSGGKRLMKIDKIIDFNSRKEVQHANDLRHNNIRRSGHLPPKKPGSHDIAYTRENLDWVIKAHHEFAEAEPLALVSRCTSSPLRTTLAFKRSIGRRRGSAVGSSVRKS